MVPQSSPQDTYQALQRAIGAMEEKGMQSDPRYSQLLALRARQVSYSAPGQTDPSRVMQVHNPSLICICNTSGTSQQKNFLENLQPCL